MKALPFALPAAVLHINDDAEQPTRTLWFADGRSLVTRVTKVEKTGIQIDGPDKSDFVQATDLCTADRVRFGFGTRKETAWVNRVAAVEAKQKSLIQAGA
jgi:hypothetical protein